MVKDNFGEGLAIERQGDLLIHEEGPDPVAKRGGKAKYGEDVYQVVNMKVVKESLNVEEKEAHNVTHLDTCLDSVHHAQDCV